MNYVIVDDEKSSVTLLQILLKEYAHFKETDTIRVFTDSEEALDYVLCSPVDVIFLDIEMPNLNGIDFARRVIDAFPSVPTAPEIIFITAYPNYAMDAWELSAFGYILKPYEAKQIYQVLDRFLRFQAGRAASDEASLETEKARILCFPKFELRVGNMPVEFQSRKAKEMLAILVHYRGNWVDLGTLSFALFEEADEAASKKYCRTILWRLKKNLAQYGLDSMIESKYGKLRVNTGGFTCDYYEYLDGEESLYQGEYMGDYPWAQETQAAMWARRMR